MAAMSKVKGRRIKLLAGKEEKREVVEGKMWWLIGVGDGAHCRIEW